MQLMYVIMQVVQLSDDDIKISIITTRRVKSRQISW